MFFTVQVLILLKRKARRWESFKLFGKATMTSIVLSTFIQYCFDTTAFVCWELWPHFAVSLLEPPGSLLTERCVPPAELPPCPGTGLWCRSGPAGHSGWPGSGRPGPARSTERPRGSRPPPRSRSPAGSRPPEPLRRRRQAVRWFIILWL